MQTRLIAFGGVLRIGYSRDRPGRGGLESAVDPGGNTLVGCRPSTRQGGNRRPPRPRIPFIGKEWFRDPKEGGLFLDAGSHCFDYLRWIAGAEPIRLYSQLATFNEDSQTPRSTMTNLAFSNGVMASLWLSYEVPTPGWDNTDFRARVVGSTGNLDTHGYGALRLGRGDAWETIYVQAPMDYINRPLERVRLKGFFRMTQDFIDALRDERQPPVTGEDGLAAVRMVEAGYRSSGLGQAVDLV